MEEVKPVEEVTEESALYSYKLEELPQPYRAIIDVPYEDLRTAFDEYFKANEDGLLNKFPVKGRKEKGGKVKNAQKLMESAYPVVHLYKPIIDELITYTVDDLLYIDGTNISNFTEDAEVVQVYAQLYKVPVLEVDADSIDYTCENPVKVTADDEWAPQAERVAMQHVDLRDFEGNEITDEEKVLVDLITSCDGNPYAPATHRGQWFMFKSLPKSLRDSFAGHQVGELWEVNYEGPNLEAGGGEAKFHTILKLHDVKTMVVPEVDDELAKRAGFDDLKAFREKFDEDFGAYVKNAQLSVAFDHIMGELVDKSKVPPFPKCWLDTNVKNQVGMFVKQQGGDVKKAMQAVGAQNETDLAAAFKSVVFQDGLRRIGMEAFARIHNLDLTTCDIREEIYKRINWVNPQ